jgi:hypothetical protein
LNETLKEKFLLTKMFVSDDFDFKNQGF